MNAAPSEHEILRFSSLELQALSALIDSEPLYGVAVEDTPLADESAEAEQFILICQGLREKHILDDNGKITRSSIPIIETLRSYKLAEAYIFINDIRLSLNRDDSVTVVARYPGETFSFHRTWPLVFVQSLADAMPWLDDDMPDILPKTISYPDEESWLGELVDFSMDRPLAPGNANIVRDMLIVHQHKIDVPKPLRSLVYYWKDGVGHIFSRDTRRLSFHTGKDIKLHIQSLVTYSQLLNRLRH
jgi:Fe-S-cluster formation regulator IscX/YfhJ